MNNDNYRRTETPRTDAGLMDVRLSIANNRQTSSGTVILARDNSRASDVTYSGQHTSSGLSSSYQPSQWNPSLQAQQLVAVEPSRRTTFTTIEVDPRISPTPGTFNSLELPSTGMTAPLHAFPPSTILKTAAVSEADDAMLPEALGHTNKPSSQVTLDIGHDDMVRILQQQQQQRQSSNPLKAAGNSTNANDHPFLSSILHCPRSSTDATPHRPTASSNSRLPMFNNYYGNATEDHSAVRRKIAMTAVLCFFIIAVGVLAVLAPK
jgi:hypothetical protein